MAHNIQHLLAAMIVIEQLAWLVKCNFSVQPNQFAITIVSFQHASDITSGSIFTCGWVRSWPMREDVTYVTSSIIGWDLVSFIPFVNYLEHDAVQWYLRDRTSCIKLVSMGGVYVHIVECYGHISDHLDMCGLISTCMSNALIMGFR